MQPCKSLREPPRRPRRPRAGLEARSMRAAASQRGLLQRAQVLAAGMSDDQIARRLRNGTWVKVLPRVYRQSSTPESWDQLLLAACLSAEGVASGRSAGALYQLDGCPAGVIEVTSHRHVRLGRGAILHRSRLQRADVCEIAGLPVTTPARTIVDLAASLDSDCLERVVDDALRRGLTSPARIERVARRLGCRGRRGAEALMALVAARSTLDARLESPLEARFLRLLRRSRMALPIAQHTVTENGRFVARIDFAYAEEKVGIEVDGFGSHAGRRAWQRDRARDNRLTALGWLMLHVTARDLDERPDATLALIARVRAARARGEH